MFTADECQLSRCFIGVNWRGPILSVTNFYSSEIEMYQYVQTCCGNRVDHPGINLSWLPTSWGWESANGLLRIPRSNVVTFKLDWGGITTNPSSDDSYGRERVNSQILPPILYLTKRLGKLRNECKRLNVFRTQAFCIFFAICVEWPDFHNVKLCKLQVLSLWQVFYHKHPQATCTVPAPVAAIHFSSMYQRWK